MSEAHPGPRHSLCAGRIQDHTVRHAVTHGHRTSPNPPCTCPALLVIRFTMSIHIDFAHRFLFESVSLINLNHFFWFRC